MPLLPIDELNALPETLAVHFEDGKIRSRRDAEDIIDELLDLFLLAYASGVTSANGELGTGIEIPFDDVQDVVYRSVAGETWEQRVWNWYDEGGTIADIYRIAETETTRIYNGGVQDVADRVNDPGVYKRWVTMEDERVRATHEWIDGVTIPYNAEFYTFDGDHAFGPGGFEKAQNNVNCRCAIELTRR